jgi:hypothetical protein
MAIFTPRGLKVNLDNRYCFALMKRLYPNITPFDVLKVTEAFELIKDIYIFIAIIISVLITNSFWLMGAIIVTISAIDSIIEHFYWRGPVLKKYSIGLFGGILFSYINGFFIYTAVVILIVYFKYGFFGIVAYFSARVVAYILDWIIAEIQSYTRRRQNLIYLKTLGTTLTKSERNFLNAYLFYSRERDIPLNLTNQELDQQNWNEVYSDLKLNWPVIAGRIT